MYFLYILYVHFLYSVLCITNVHFCNFESCILRILFYISSIILLINEAVVVHLKIIYAYSLIYICTIKVYMSLSFHTTLFVFLKFLFSISHFDLHMSLCDITCTYIYIYLEIKNFIRHALYVRTNCFSIFIHFLIIVIIILLFLLFTITIWNIFLALHSTSSISFFLCILFFF